jgi:hypothetical protein
MIQPLFLRKTCRKGRSYLNNDVIINPQSKAEFRKSCHARDRAGQAFRVACAAMTKRWTGAPGTSGMQVVEFTSSRTASSDWEAAKRRPCVSWIYTDALWHGRLHSTQLCTRFAPLGRSIHNRHHPKRLKPGACEKSFSLIDRISECRSNATKLSSLCESRFEGWRRMTCG